MYSEEPHSDERKEKLAELGGPAVELWKFKAYKWKVQVDLYLHQ